MQTECARFPCCLAPGLTTGTPADWPIKQVEQKSINCLYIKLIREYGALFHMGQEREGGYDLLWVGPQQEAFHQPYEKGCWLWCDRMSGVPE